MSSEALYYMNLEFVKLNLDFLDFGVIFDTLTDYTLFGIIKLTI